MKTGSSRVVFLLGLLLAAVPAPGDEPRVKAVEPEEIKRLNALIESAIGWYQLLPDAHSKEPMAPRPVLRWTNVTRGKQGAEGVFVLWLDGGRPEAFASIYPRFGNIHHEFVSLSKGGTMVAVDREDGRVAWSPEVAGVLLREVPDAPAPAASPAARLIQMKAQAGRFRVTMTGWKTDSTDREELRLLPKPLYRYELDTAKAASANVGDGAVFAFVQGTDPEAVLVIESIRKDDRPRWHYAFARATSGGLEARLGTAVVWSAERTSNEPRPRSAQLTLGRPDRP